MLLVSVLFFFSFFHWSSLRWLTSWQKNIFIQKHQPQPTSLNIIKVESNLTCQHNRQQDHDEHVQVESKSIRPHRGALARAGRGGAGRGIRFRVKDNNYNGGGAQHVQCSWWQLWFVKALSSRLAGRSCSAQRKAEEGERSRRSLGEGRTEGGEVRPCPAIIVVVVVVVVVFVAVVVEEEGWHLLQQLLLLLTWFFVIIVVNEHQ